MKDNGKRLKNRAKDKGYRQGLMARAKDKSRGKDAARNR